MLNCFPDCFNQIIDSICRSITKHSDAITVVLLSSYRSLGLKLNAAACYGWMDDVCVGRCRGRIRLEALV